MSRQSSVAWTVLTVTVLGCLVTSIGASVTTDESPHKPVTGEAVTDIDSFVRDGPMLGDDPLATSQVSSGAEEDGVVEEEASGDGVGALE